MVRDYEFGSKTTFADYSFEDNFWMPIPSYYNKNKLNNEMNDNTLVSIQAI